MARFELKYPLSRWAYLRFESWFACHGHVFRRAHADRKVNNIYLDSFDLSCYSDNLDGISRRSKLRLRWYGETSLPGQAVFELKQRTNSTGWKQKVPVDLGGYRWRSWSELMRSFGRDLPRELMPYRPLLANPVLLNSYRRSYFEDARGVRLTVDRELRAAALRRSSHLAGSATSPLAVYRVVELKFSQRENAYVRSLFADLGLRPERFSKYVAGIDRAYP